MRETIPAGKRSNQYLQHIYPAVRRSQNPTGMSFSEHWRLRLQELVDNTGLTQAAFADRADITADYLSRLLYPPGKAGRKNLGAVTMRKISAGFDLPPGWFDLPLNTPFDPKSAPYSTSIDDAMPHGVSDIGTGDAGMTPEPITWPFQIVSYQRIARIRKHFSGRSMPPAISDIDKHLDVLVTRWENEMLKTKRSAA